MIKKIFFLSFLVFAIGTSACSVVAQKSGDNASQGSNEEYIKGSWRLNGELPPGNSGHTFHWFLEYTFSSDGTYLLSGYPPLLQKGKYRVVKSEEKKLILDLYEQSGNFGTKDKQIEITIDRDNETLKIDGKEGFKNAKRKQDR